MPSRADFTRESTARDTCRIFAAAYEPPSLIGVMLAEVLSLGAIAAFIMFIFVLCSVIK